MKQKKQESRLRKRQDWFDRCKGFSDLDKNKRWQNGGYHRPGSPKQSG